jgi:CRP/FNR family transcriptional regulator, cyclic AMP receptor protein
LAVAKKSKPKFDPEAFLAKADGGVNISKYRKGQVVFTQGEPADSVFYIREGGVKISVVSTQGKEAVVALLKAGDLSVRVVSQAGRGAFRPPGPWKIP